ncbi:nucleoside phosphorylase [Pluralibacter gergoviae]|uniref:nucleoside phosphorylase n=1 Tax=Pluralibacter gergoviae TaxID=61647 RepID=UPI0004F66CA2|nr:nucleoside phosphorylase [Pluralibacter gergoviae]AIR03017.1 uridine phosphorylase [Pluralibacter gergoviae]EKZ9513905.1 nucleoside phosphorylase [Pluralibacter gergoviae]ELC3016001.1 nucleoside phosphorylase [Pluralibacter gergoviae]ELC3020980.1 nucleoside phosphorylase [Pluralibacter gergoviae]KMK10242.1 uridine phosphorylase [Pluralibacter gergoviae]
MAKMLHTHLDENDVGRYAFLPGSPERVPLIAEYLDDFKKVMQHREHTTYSGYLEGELVLVTSTGMGGSSSAICTEELGKLGVDTFIRIGTGASTSPDVNKGDLVILNGTVRMEGTSSHYVPMEFPAVPDYQVLTELDKASRKLGFNYKVGISITKDSFFTQIEPETRPNGWELKHKWESYVKGGAIITSMEEAVLFVIGTSFNYRMGSVLVCATDYTGPDVKAKQTVKAAPTADGYPREHIHKGIEVGIEAMRQLILSDKLKRT